MGTGYLKIQVTTADGALPIRNAHITIKRTDGMVLYETNTDANGSTDIFSLPAPDKQYTLDPHYTNKPYSVYDVDISSSGFVTEHIHQVEIFDTQTEILPVHLYPLVDEPQPVTDIDIDIPIAGPLVATQYLKTTTPSPIVLNQLVIPDYITVHLGVPSNESARNVRVKFPDYIKNVTSSEIYSTWPYNSIVANVHAITTFALNRVYTEWYRSRGFPFDITNSTSYDQYFRDGAQIPLNISQIVDGIFNVYAHRYGFRNPFFTQFCNGTTVTCPGLSQWGTVTLANQGMSPLDILRYYYPRDIQLAASQNISGIPESYPGYQLSLGGQSEHIRRMQNYLNRIRVNFPLIPPISNPNGVFGTDTQNAVRTFQRTYNLNPDGVIGRATWNKISFVFVGVTRLAELDSEGERISIGMNPPNTVLSVGSRGEDVLELQFILNSVSPYYTTIPSVIKNGIFDETVKNAVIEFQKTFSLTPDGVVGPGAWNKLYAVYRGINDNVHVPPAPPPPTTDRPAYPGTPLQSGSTGANVRLMQTYLNTIRIVYNSIPYLIVDGIFGEGTKAAVTAFQREFLLDPDGIIGPTTWNKIVEQYLLVTGGASTSLEYPGTPLKVGSRGNAVRTMQTFLSELRSPYPSLPAISVDGIFGPNTQAAVIQFQRLLGLTPDGIIGPITWYAIVNQRNSRV